MSGPGGGRRLDVDATVMVVENQVASDLAGEVVLLSLETGMYYGLDEVGARVWELIQQPATVENVCQTILAEYEVEREQCQSDVLALLSQLSEAGLIEVRDAAKTD